MQENKYVYNYYLSELLVLMGGVLLFTTFSLLVGWLKMNQSEGEIENRHINCKLGEEKRKQNATR